MTVHHDTHATPDSREPGSSSTAIVQHRYGPPDLLRPQEIPQPVPGPGEVLVRVRAASINARDWHVMRGEPRLARMVDRETFGLVRPRVAVRGTDLAGTVRAVGAGVARWQPGDRVFGEGIGTLAQYAVASDEQLAAVPESVSFEEAAAIPLAATTAAACLESASPTPGQTILVNGASGGVGTFAIQLAKVMGLKVTAVVSTRNVALARELGADHVIDYRAADFTCHPDRYDIVLDLVGNRPLGDLRDVMSPGGVLVLSGGGVSGQGRLVGPLRLLVLGKLVGRLRGVRIHAPQAKVSASELERLGGLVVSGRIRPVIDRRFTLEHAAGAIEYMETQHARAKVVVLM